MERGRTKMLNSVTVPSLWDENKAKGLDEPGLLLYRSNLLGANLHITNFGGVNTSAKVAAKDPLSGEPVTVLWVKGSGGDIGSMKLDGFATLYMDKLESLKGLYKSLDQEDAMVHALNHCIFDLNPRAPSADSEKLTREIFGDEMGYLPWQRPGIDLGIKLGEMAKKNPQYVGVVLGSHGLFTWGRTAKECYDTTLRIINKAAVWLERNSAKPAFKGARVESLPDAERRAVA